MSSANKSRKSYAGSGTSRARSFATVVYPESAPANWLSVLAESHISALISPLHDMDTNPDGERKKPHYHVLLMFEGVKNFDTQVKPIFDAIGGVGREMVNSARGYARYLCHLDNPEKHQYSPSDVRSFGGADYISITHLPTDEIAQLQEIFNFISCNQILSYAELVDICSKFKPDWFSTIVMTRTIAIKEYIKSYSFELQAGYQRVEIDDAGNIVIPDKRF